MFSPPSASMACGGTGLLTFFNDIGRTVCSHLSFSLKYSKSVVFNRGTSTPGGT
jgi:hypothetical protein